MSKLPKSPSSEELLLPTSSSAVKILEGPPIYKRLLSRFSFALVAISLVVLVWPSGWFSVRNGDGPQLPIPGPIVEPNQAQLRLNPNWDINAPPQTRVFYWELSQMAGAPDGFSKPMLVVNGQFPGPLIEANLGDTIVVLLQNNLAEGTSIHWHGLDQNGTVYMDGLTGVNQCPIAPGQLFQYEFKLEQFGTFWWHSHYSTQYTDGVSGPLIIHSPDDPLKYGEDYDVDQLVVLDDWWHDRAEYITAQMLAGNYTDDGIESGAAAPAPDAGLINGVGVFNCSYIDNPHCPGAGPLEIHVEPGQRVRLRLISTGSHAQQRFSIDEHPLEVIEADSNPVAGPSGLHRVPVHDGQRYSVILDANVGKDGDAYWIRSSFVTDCFAFPLPVDSTTLAVLRYVANGSTPSTQLPSSTDWSDPSTTGECVDLDPGSLVPLIAEVPPPATQSAVFNFTFNFALARFVVNGVTYVNTPYDSILYAIYENQPINASEVTTATFNSIGATDLAINNLDAGIDHPVHLHGVDFWIIGHGNGTITESQARSLNYTDNPVRRDTVVVPRASWIVLRIITDDPGVWGIHCHIAFHLASGFLGAVIVQPDEIRALRPPNAWFQDCRDGPATATIPGRRSIETPVFGRRESLLSRSDGGILGHDLF